MDKIEAHAVIKYVSLLEKYCYGAGKSSLESNIRGSRSYIFVVAHWRAEFKRGRTSINDKLRTGRPTSVMTKQIISKVENIVLSDFRVTVCFIAEENMEISIDSLYNIIHNHIGSQIKKVSALDVQNAFLRAETNETESYLGRIQQDLDRFLTRFITMTYNSAISNSEFKAIPYFFGTAKGW